jgi:hypothetical protein
MGRNSLRAVVLAATTLTAALLFINDTTPARLPVALAFALVIPGLGWACRLRLRDRGDTLLFAVTISICLLVLVGEGMALLRLWSVTGGFLILAAIGALGVCLPQPFRLPLLSRFAKARTAVAPKLPPGLANGSAGHGLDEHLADLPPRRIHYDGYGGDEMDHRADEQPQHRTEERPHDGHASAEQQIPPDEREKPATGV